MLEERLEEKYRPAIFGDVVGQDYAVRLLSGLVTRGSRGRHVLLHGAVGSGKTTLIRIFARALNCVMPSLDGSPCGSCAECRDPHVYLHECDVPKLSGDVDEISAWLAEHQGRGQSGSRVQVFFFDEAHALKAAAQDLLLKRIESAPTGIIYCFATTEIGQLRSALVSRLFDIRIRSLSAEIAVDQLERIAKKEGIWCDRAALFVLAAAKPPYLRDLVIGLSQLSGLADHIDAALVEEFFELDHGTHVFRYWIALADGDERAQSDTLKQWRDPINLQVSWIRRFLVCAFYNEVVGQDVVSDPLVYSMSRQRREVIQRFCTRIGVERPYQLRSQFETMLDFWLTASEASDELLRLQLARFESFVNHGLSTPIELHRPPMFAKSIEDSSVSVDVADDLGWTIVPVPPDSCFMEEADVGLIINRSSFLTQHYGHYFNVLCSVAIRVSDAYPERACFDQLLVAAQQLPDMGAGDGGASIMTVERDQDVLVGRIAAFLPISNQPELPVRLQVWRGLKRDKGSVSRSCRFRESEEAERFHRNVVLELCAGLQGEGNEEDSLVSLRQEMRRARIEVRNPGPLDCPRLVVSPLLGGASISKACEFGMLPLSAYDDDAWSFVFSGWELDEHQDRKCEIRRRVDEVAQLAQRFGEDSSGRASELQRLIDYWAATHPSSRPRTWRGWWVC